MARKFKELVEKMPAERRAKAEAKAKDLLAEMLLSEVRRHVGLTQEELADRLGIRQPSLSKLESQRDMQIGTLSRIVAALGGNLELVAHLPNGDIRITQFEEKTVPAG